MSALFETHAHLCDAQFEGDREAALERARAAGIARVIEIADSPDEWDHAIELAGAHPDFVKCSLGLHPYYADRFDLDFVGRLVEKLARPEVVAVGEIGLDYVKAGVGREKQVEAFRRLIDFACKGRKPAVVHCRGAYEDLRKVLAETVSGPPQHGRFWGVIHCFSGNKEDALFCRDLGFALGVDGPVTYPKNDELRAALAAAGPDCLVLETDSPYLPPQSRRGKRNEPSLLPEIAAKLAEVCGLTPDQLADVTTRNARSLYGL